MRSIVYEKSGPSSVLELVEREAREPAAGEVRVAIRVSGVNPTDWKSRSSSDPDGVQVPDQDGAGVVDAVGAGIERFSVGDRVWLWDAAYHRADGTAQEQVVIDADHVMPLPDSASFELGASLGIPALIAHLALTAGGTMGVAEDTPLSPGSLAGRTVLVAGGAGAVGHAAIELARWAGATVIATISSDEKGALSEAAGAHVVIDYTSEDVAARIRETDADGVDHVVEVNPNANAELDVEVAKTGSTIASYAGETGQGVEIPVRGSMAKNLAWRFLLTYTAPEAAKRAALAGVQEALEAGALRIGEDAGLPLTVFDLEHTAGAHDAVEGGAVGKVLVRVAAD